MKPRSVTLLIYLCGFLLVLAFSLASRKLLGADFWYFGLPCAYLVLQWLVLFVIEPSRQLGAIGMERVEVNLRWSGIRVPRVWFFVVRGLIVAAFVGSFLLMALRRDIVLGWERVVTALQNEQAILRIEYAAYKGLKPLEVELVRGSPQTVSCDTGALLELLIKNRQGAEAWMVTATILEPQPAHQPLSFSMARSGRFTRSAGSLVEAAGIPRTQTSKWLLEIRDGAKEKPFLANLEIIPIPLPKVSLDPLGATPDESGSFRLQFATSVTASVPLTSVVFSVRTQSGFRFEKIVAEFAGSDEMQFASSDLQLNTMGIPFVEKDILFVKALARTVIPDVVGESQELSFPISSRAEIGKQVAEHLLKAHAELDRLERSIDESRRVVLEELSRAAEAARGFGLRSPVLKKLQAVQDSAQKIASRNDRPSSEVQRKIESILESMKRSEDASKMASLFHRLQNLRNTIQTSSEPKLTPLAPDAAKLAMEFSGLKDLLSKGVMARESPLTPEERQVAERLLKMDDTAVKLGETSESLQKGDLSKSVVQVDRAAYSAQKHLVPLLELLAAARRRAMAEARQHLTAADRNLDSARGGEGEQQRAQIKRGREELERTPGIGREFDEALAQARVGAQRAEREEKRGDQKGVQEGITSAQDGIVEALAALQEEQEQEEQTQREIEGGERHISQEILEAQGVLDSGWRKSILEEIARLKAQGESSDSALLRYFESKLR